MSREIIFYSTHCPKCSVLEKKLASKEINYTLVDDTDVMISKGFTSAPLLEIIEDGNSTVLDFKQAIDFVNKEN